MKTHILILGLVIVLAFTNKLNAQEDQKRQIGISATIQNDQLGFLLPIWITDKITISPAINFSYAEKVGTDYSLGIVPKFYLRTGKVSPFVDLRVGALFNNPSNTTINKNTVDWLWGVGFGGEYFIDDNFSFGIELQGNFTKSDKNSNRFGNPGGLNFNITTLVSANIYF
jgi:hypothetical protein